MNAPPHVVGGMRTTLPLRQPVQRGVPAISPQPRRIVQGNAGVVAQLSAGPALLRIFVVPRGPLAGEINLGEHRNADERCEGKNRETNEAGRTVVLHLALREKSKRLSEAASIPSRATIEPGSGRPD